MERILSFSEKLSLLPKDGLILCALSGGRDSVALLHFLKEHGFTVAAAHFDHRLRPESAADAAFCRELCAEWNVPFYEGAGDVAEMRGNTEANARAARYAFLEETAGRLGAARLATAHNADDNLETILLHLTRGCGLNGLTGIQPRRGLLVRPMLRTPRAAVDAYVKERGLPYVEDATNADVRFSRNRIRQKVLPVLKSINPKVVEVSSFMAETLREDYQYLEAHRPLPNPTLSPPVHPPFTPSGPPVYPPFTPLEPPLNGTSDTPLWRLSLRQTPCAPRVSPTPTAFYLRLPLPGGPLFLRSRRPGDAIHPPFRTGKTVKKWFNELGVPVGEREATPILTDGENILSVAGIGPNQAFLAEPGQKSIFVQWTKKREEPDT